MSLTYQLIVDIINTNCLIALSEYPVKYLELVSVFPNFEKTILSTFTSQIFIGSLAASTFLLLHLSLETSTLLLMKKNCDYFLANLYVLLSENIV